jgi:hypothetical protein
MNKTAAVLLLISFALLTAGAAVLLPAAGLLTAGLLAGAAGLMSLTAGPKKTNAKEPR